MADRPESRAARFLREDAGEAVGDILEQPRAAELRQRARQQKLDRHIDLRRPRIQGADVVSYDGARARRTLGVPSSAAHRAAKVLIVALHVENAVECADDGAELDVDLAFGALPRTGLVKRAPRHAARHLIEIGKKPPDLGAREGDGKRLPQLHPVTLDGAHSTASKFSAAGDGAWAFGAPAAAGLREKSFGVAGGCEPTGPILRSASRAADPDAATVFSAL